MCLLSQSSTEHITITKICDFWDRYLVCPQNYWSIHVPRPSTWDENPAPLLTQGTGLLRSPLKFIAPAPGCPYGQLQPKPVCGSSPAYFLFASQIFKKKYLFKLK